MDIVTYLRHGDHDHDHDHDHDEGSSNGIMVAKVVTMCCLFLTSFFVGTTPLYLSRIFRWKIDVKDNKVVIRMLCFGGGVLLCTTFLHLVPEVAENIEDLQGQGLFPNPESFEMHFAEFFMCCGFFILYFVEEIIHYYLHKKEKDSMVVQLTRTFSIRRESQLNSESKKVDIAKPDVENELPAAHCEGHMHNHVDHSHMNFDDALLKSFRGFFIVLALSVHELFEGLAVGLESSTSSVWYMFAAVSAHKIVIAFCIGVELITSDISRLLTVIYVFTFAVVSPLGIGIGIILSEDQEGSTQVVSVVLQGLASGTLLYIVFFEILRTDRKGGVKTYLSVFFGFAVMFAITVFIPHGHEHSH